MVVEAMFLLLSHAYSHRFDPKKNYFYFFKFFLTEKNYFKIIFKNSDREKKSLSIDIFFLIKY